MSTVAPRRTDEASFWPDKLVSFDAPCGEEEEEESQRGVSLPFGAGPHAPGPARWECQAILAGAGS
eukprot:1000957-Prymnesium_polylepis.1